MCRFVSPELPSGLALSVSKSELSSCKQCFAEWLNIEEDILFAAANAHLVNVIFCFLVVVLGGVSCKGR